MPNENLIDGRRMLDVRVQIAKLGGGMLTADKINAGHYVITTADDRRWIVTETAAGTWRGMLETQS